MSEVEVFEPGASDYDRLHATVSSKDNQPKPRKSFDYDPMVRAYNAAKPQSIIVAPDGATTIRGNLAAILINRDGIEGEDFEVTKPRSTADGQTIPAKDRRLVIKKLSYKSLRLTRIPQPE